VIYVDEEKTQGGILYLVHEFENKPLKADFIENTMIGIEFLWGGPVYLETSIPAGKEQKPAPPVHFLDPSAGGAGTKATPVKRETIKWQRVCYIMDKRKLNRREVA
ncbi:MAG: SpoVR family protein, partial [Desulfobacter sp.]|nr:SpoVR family protein [Desulfobacter sp.]